MRFVRGFGRFWYDFLVGDDWKIAAGVVTTLALSTVVLLVFEPREQIFTTCVGLTLMAVFAVVLRIDVKRRQ